MSSSKTVCPISRRTFVEQARPVELQVDGQTCIAEAKQFTTGSFGWHYGDKVWLKVGNTRVKVQVGLTLTVIGSKDAPSAFTTDTKSDVA